MFPAPSRVPTQASGSHLLSPLCPSWCWNLGGQDVLVTCHQQAGEPRMAKGAETLKQLE